MSRSAADAARSTQEITAHEAVPDKVGHAPTGASLDRNGKNGSRKPAKRIPDRRF
jgi:hypothetical protein